MRVVAWNVQQGGGSRIPRIVSALTALDPDVLVLSEHRASGPQAAAIAAHGWTHQLGLADPAGGYAAVLVASRRPLRRLESHPDETCSQRWVHVVLAVMVVASVIGRYGGLKPLKDPSQIRAIRRS